MKKWIASLVICGYLSFLGWGIVSHTLGFATGAHPSMYYVVWDMFCGWSSYSSRILIVGEGESGKYYELAPGPWGDFRPFGSIGRQHYDGMGNHAPKLALNALRHTKHEPITRIFVIEQIWAKKYNLPDKLWKKRFDEPKQVHKYHHIRHVFSPDGSVVQSFPSWFSQQYSHAVANNPRLKNEQRKGRPFFTMKYRNRTRDIIAPGTGAPRQHVGSRLGN
ncbi:MAG: hypothetical protein Tsb009_14190 [Planctomycetaceae bacterium]